MLYAHDITVLARRLYFLVGMINVRTVLHSALYGILYEKYNSSKRGIIINRTETNLKHSIMLDYVCICLHMVYLVTK